jgi:hypothetical protein
MMFSRNCGLAEKIVGRPVPLLNNPLAPQPAHSFVELRESVIPMLLALGPSMHYDPVLMYKVLRLAKAALTQVLRRCLCVSQGILSHPSFHYLAIIKVTKLYIPHKGI